MRGLDERVHLALARIANIADAAQGGVLLEGVGDEAMALGWEEYGEGISTPPIMFAGERLLLSAWELGQKFAADSAALHELMLDCPDCNNPDLLMCTWHG